MTRDEARTFLGQNFEQVCAHLYPAGKQEGLYWIVGDINGTPGESFKICLAGEKRGLYQDFASRDKAERDLIGLWMKARCVPFQTALSEIAAFAGVAHGNGNGKEPPVEGIRPTFDWSACVRALTDERLAEIAEWRGYSIEFCRALVADGQIGLYQDKIAFPVRDQAGNVVGPHYYVPKKHDWRYTTGTKVRPLVYGDLYNAGEVHAFESQWDALGVMERCGLYKEPGVAFFITRGSSNGGLIRGRLPESADVLVWPQNDKPKEDGSIPSEIWLEGLISAAGRRARIVRTPKEYEDANAWTRAGAHAEQIREAIVKAEVREAVAQQYRDPFGSNGEAATEPAAPEVTDEELAELDKAALERYRLKDRPFPAPMGEDAFYGVCGDIVRIIEPVSEASREAILAQLLVALGNMIGRGPHCKQAAFHYLNEFAVMAGETAIARKGTAWAAINNLLHSVNEDWLANRLRDGFQSGEAIIHAVRDAQYGVIPINKRKAGEADKAETTLIDEGVTDKRLLIVEEEFARLLTVASRQGNTLSSTLRKAWDAKQWLHTEGKISPEKATGAHISMIGHVTIRELLDCLSTIENKNGFSNRVLWIATKRTKKLALPPWINWRKDHPAILQRLNDIINYLGPDASKRELHWSDQGKKDWCEFYNSIKSSGSGVVGAIVARTDAHVLRMTMLFTVLDGSALMEPQHLKAAIAFWQYCERSASWIFGQKTGDKAADKIYWALQHEPKGLTRTKIIEDVFNKHISATNLDMALSTLVDAELACFNSERVKGAAKPTQRWFAKPLE